MKVKELIETLSKFDPELEVKIHPDPELVFDGDISFYGEVGDIEVRNEYLDENDSRFDGGIYKDFETLIEDNESILIDKFKVDEIDLIADKDDLEKWANRFEKLNAVVIRATV